jgi:hypothetical protein
VWLREYRHNLREGLLEKSKLAQHSDEEGHRVGWDNARVYEIENNSNQNICMLINPISQASLDISPVWCPLISNEVSNSQRRSL